jgi:hypothetical protein
MVYIYDSDAQPADQVPVPSRFTYVKPDGKLNVWRESFAGAAVGFLVDKDPALLPALIEARRSVEGLREVAGRINAIRPGLYQSLRDNYNSPELFDDGLIEVADRLGIKRL